jgi:hypothetical protein
VSRTAYLYGGADTMGLGQDTCDDSGCYDTSGGTTTDTPIVISNPANDPAGTIEVGGTAGSSSGLSPTAGATPGLPAFCASEGWVYNAATDLCQAPAGSSTSAAAIANDISALLAGGNKIAQTVTGNTGTTVNASSLMLLAGAALVVVLLISMVGKK